MSFMITGPGEYRTRDGRKATIWRLTNYGRFSAVGDIESVREMWQSNGLTGLDAIDNDDIIAHWEEDTVTKPTAKDIASKIAALPICDRGKAGVTELVEALGFEVEKKPEPKAGQVWQLTSEGFTAPCLLVRCRGILIPICLDKSFNWFVGSFAKTNIKEYDAKLIAESADEYYANKNK